MTRDTAFSEWPVLRFTALAVGVLCAAWIAVALWSPTQTSATTRQVDHCAVGTELCADESSDSKPKKPPFVTTKPPPGWRKRCHKHETKRHCKRRIEAEGSACDAGEVC